jgi:hypothetical protein
MAPVELNLDSVYSDIIGLENRDWWIIEEADEHFVGHKQC